MRPIIVLGLTLVACGGETDAGNMPDATLPSTPDSQPALVQFVDPAQLPEFPDFPRARSGTLRVESSGPADLASTAEAAAGVCQNPSMLMLSSGDQDSWGYILLLQVPLEGNRELVYPVAHVDRGFPVPPASQVGVQRVTAAGGDAYQGLQGFAEVTGFSETAISGRFQITVRHIVTEEMVQLAGSFEDIEIHQMSPQECLPAAALSG